MSWREQAMCVRLDPGLFFPADTGDPWTLKSAADAVRPYCELCPSRAECLTEALATATMDGSGLWAGTTPRERRTLARRKDLVPA